MKRFFIFLFLCACFVQPSIAWCQEKPTSIQQIVTDVDYSLPQNWAAFPSKIDKKVDVFYVYPTIYMDEKRPNMDWMSQEDTKKAALKNIKMNTGAMQSIGNIYAPFYRQADLSSALKAIRAKDLSGNLQIGFKDVQKAFEYYIQHLNHGRPFILFSHSQGTMATFEMMKRLFHNPIHQEKLIAAYLIGYSLPKEDFKTYPFLKFAQGETDTGVIITWNTQAKDAKDDLFALPGSMGINPLNWKRDETPAEAAENLGTVYFDDAGEIVEEIPELVGATLNPANGALIANPPHTDLYEEDILGQKVYHKGDISLFYRNIEENARLRTEQFLHHGEKTINEPPHPLAIESEKLVQ